MTSRSTALRVRLSDAERRGNTIQGFHSFYLKAKARIWSGRSCMCHICSTAGRVLKTSRIGDLLGCRAMLRNHSVDFEGFDPAAIRGVRDQTCTA